MFVSEYKFARPVSIEFVGVLNILLDHYNKPHWVTRPDGTVEKDGVIEGKATSFSEALSSGEAIWDKLAEDTNSRKKKNNREKEWRKAHNNNE